MGYEGSFWFGDPPQEVQVIFDTGSPTAWVFSENCGITDQSKCPHRQNRFLQSRSPKFQSNEAIEQNLEYGQGSISGHPSQDRGCFSSDPSACISDLNFLTVVKGKDLETLKGSGIIGLCPHPGKEAQLSQPLKNGVPGFIA